MDRKVREWFRDQLIFYSVCHKIFHERRKIIGVVHENSMHPGLVLCQRLLIFSPITPLLNLHSLIFGLTPFDWLHSIKLTLYFWRK